MLKHNPTHTVHGNVQKQYTFNRSNLFVFVLLTIYRLNVQYAGMYSIIVPCLICMFVAHIMDFLTGSQKQSLMRRENQSHIFSDFINSLRFNWNKVETKGELEGLLLNQKRGEKLDKKE